MTFQLRNNIPQLHLFMRKCGLTTYAANSKIEYLEFYREVKIEDRLRKNYKVDLLFDGEKVVCEIIKKTS